MTLTDNRSAGNFTHIILIDLRGIYAPGEPAGMRTTRILELLGAGWSQVSADGTLSRATNAPCPASGYGDAAAAGGGGKPKGKRPSRA